MLRTTLPLLTICMSFGCIDYEIKQLTQPTEGTESQSPDISGDAILAQECPVYEMEDYLPDLSSNCISEPEIGEFNPVVEWEWSENTLHEQYNHIETAPIVLNLNDDNEDGFIDEQDIPDIVFVAFFV